MCREDNKIPLSWPQEQQNCQISSFLDQESIWSADQITGVYIYGRTSFCLNNFLSNATQGVVSPGKGFLWGISFRKNGAWFFWGEHS